MCILYKCFEHQKCVFGLSIQNVPDRNVLTLSSSSSQEVGLSVRNVSLTGVNRVKWDQVGSSSVKWGLVGSSRVKWGQVG